MTHLSPRRFMSYVGILQVFIGVFIGAGILVYSPNVRASIVYDSEFGSNLSLSGGIAVDANGNIYATGYEVIYKYNSAKAQIATYTSAVGSTPMIGVTADTNALYVSYAGDADRIEQLSPSFHPFAYPTSQPTGLNEPIDLVVSGSSLYVVDSGSDVIKKYTTSGTGPGQSVGSYVSSFGSSGSGNGQFSYPWGIAKDSSGNIYVVDSGNSRIQKFDASGVYISQFGTYGTGQGQFMGPSDIAVDSVGHIYVADAGNHRIQKFNASGTYLREYKIPDSFYTLAVDSEKNIFYKSNGTIKKLTQPSTFCDTVLDVPVAECDALMSIYNNTGGANWTNKTNWGTSGTVGSWYGVTVSSGHVRALNLPYNNLIGNVLIESGNLNSLEALRVSNNNLSGNFSITPGTLGSIVLLDLSQNNYESISGREDIEDTILSLDLSNNQLATFSGVGLSNLGNLYLSNNQLATFSGVGLSSLVTLNLSNNQLVSFDGVGMGNLLFLILQNNKLTAFNGGGLEMLQILNLSNNLVSSFSPNVIAITNLLEPWWESFFGNNCLDDFSLPVAIVDWLDTVAVDEWTVRNPACPPLPSTLYFWNVSGSGDWNNTANWYTDIDHSNPAGRIADATNNAIILSNVASNSGAVATVKSLQVFGTSTISIPIINNGSAPSFTTTLAGDNNDITWTASDPEVTITYATPVEQAETTVEVNGKNITITPGTKSVMNVTDGPWGYPVKVFFVRRDGEIGPVIWTSTGAYNENNFSGLTCMMQVGTDYQAVCEFYENGLPMGGIADRTETQPYGWYPYLDNIPQNLWNSGISFQPMVSSASQVIAAVAANPAAAALISGSLASGNDGTGSVTAMTQKTVSTPANTYATPMSFLDTSTNAAGNTLTGDAVFACTAQNLGIVTGTTIFSRCDATTAPTTTSPLTDTTPTFTGACASDTLVTLYNNGATALTPSVLCSAEGTYSITPTLSPGNYTITVKQSNRKGPTFGTSNASSPVLNHVIGCPEGQDWNGITCASVCTTTEAPSELKANVDKPYISCTKGGAFKYRISQPSPGIQYSSQFGGHTSPFDLPGDLASDSTGNIYVADSNNYRIQKFNPQGVFVSQINLPNNPTGVALDSTGNIYVVRGATLAPKITKFNSSGVEQLQFGTYGSGNGQLKNPQGIAIDTLGNIYVADTGNHRIQKFSSTGTYLSQFGTPTLDMFGSPIKADGKLSSPYDLAIDSTGNIYVADTGNMRIQKFNSSGVYQSQFGTYGLDNGQFDNPYYLTLDTSGNIYVGDAWNNRIQKFNSSGVYQSKFGTSGSGDGQFNQAVGIAIGASDNIYVSDLGNSRIQILSQTSSSFTPITSASPADGRVLHNETLSAGEYTVECLYSNDNYTTADTCTKTMVVRESTAGDEVQGCARITNNFENFVGYEKWTHSAGFNASVSCIARKSDPEVTDPEISPFLIQYGSTFTTLGYLNSFFNIGRFSSAIDVHTFDSSLSTPTTCAVRVGDGYSTNSLCQNLGCGGPECDAPSQYIIQPSVDNLYCTREANAEYSIGCAPGDSYAGCIRNDIVGNLYHGLTLQTGGEYDGKYTKTWKFRLDADTTSPETVRTIVCDSATPQTNENTTLNCTISLPTGKELAMLVATDPVDQYQIVYDPVPRDVDAPMASISGTATDVTFDTSNTRVLASSGSAWLNTPVVANIRCVNTEPENNDTCTCAWLVKADTTGTKDNTDWGLVSPLKDIVDYQRIIRNESLQNQEFFIFDNVGNMDPDKSKVSINLGVDTLLPSISAGTVTSGENNKESVILQATDNAGGSGLWGYGIRTVVINNTATSEEIKGLFNEKCNIITPQEGSGTLPLGAQSPALGTVVYAPFPETGAGFGPINSASIEYNTTSQKIAYCVQDNAKNKLVGTYPFDPNMLIGCFSDGSQQFVPNLDTINPSGRYYIDNLITRFLSGKYGYELTDSSKSDATLDFRTKLAQNIETLVKQQYCPTMGNFANKSVNLEEKNTEESPLVYAAKAKLANTACSTTDSVNVGPRNTQGYYYFKGDAQNRVLEIAGSPRLTGVKTLIVEGADIYLKDDINYFSRESSLVIIALKDSGGIGGNIYVNPEVMHIDSTLIADGALMNGVLDGTNIIPKAWINDSAGDLKNPLVINGRLLTYNTRGGSLDNNNGTLEMKTDSPLCASNTAPISTDVCSFNLPQGVSSVYSSQLNWSALQDLERFRVVMRVPDELNNRCTLHVTGVPALNRPEILTRSGF